MSVPADLTAAVRRFLAPTSREALRQVREVLGGEAVVLSSRSLDAQGVEVLAMRSGSAPAAPVETHPHGPSQHAPAAAGGEPVMWELQAMRSLLEERLAAAAPEAALRDPARWRVTRRLLDAGFSPRLGRMLLARLPAGATEDEGVAFAHAELARTLPAQCDEEALLAAGGVLALMGPTGVGKTTTTAKLAARYVMRHGAGSLALVTTDDYRIGAIEQLRIYGQILGVPVHAAGSAADLQRVFQQLRGKHLVLIDTVGMSQRDRAVSAQIAMLDQAGRKVKSLLLLNATSHGDTLNEVAHAYRQAADRHDLIGCIFTKTDEAARLGALVETAIRHRLPVHYLATGQRVPEDLALVDRARFVEQVLRPAASPSVYLAEAEGDAAPLSAAKLAAAQQETERLRARCRQLVDAMAQDARQALLAAPVLDAHVPAFATARALWRQLSAQDPAPVRVEQTLLAQARSALAQGCTAHVLALHGRCSIGGGAGTMAAHAALLLSDRDGASLGATGLWLSPRSQRAGGRLVQALQHAALGRPVVHLLPQVPRDDEAAAWQTGRDLWLAAARSSTPVVDAMTGHAIRAGRLDFANAVEMPLSWQGRAALARVSEAPVHLPRSRGSGAAGAALRCIALQVVDRRGGRTLARQLWLTHADEGMERLAGWACQALQARPWFRTLAPAMALAGGLGELGDPWMRQRAMTGLQLALAVHQLQRSDLRGAEPVPALLASLGGGRSGAHAASPQRLCRGLVRLFQLLEGLADDAAEQPAEAMR